ncbi:MAG: hypothetical protein ACTHOU_11455, partial [Aureliella sp.]
MRYVKPVVRPLLVLLALIGGIASSTGRLSAAVTLEQRQQMAEIEGGIAIAGRLYAANKYTESGEKITEVQRSLIQLLENKDPALQRLLKPLYGRLEKAHALLELEGAEMEELPTWDKLTGASQPPAASSVSFKADVAPWLVAQCGNCHINNKRGQFS